MMEKYGDDWEMIFLNIKKCKPNADAIAELSYRNFSSKSLKQQMINFSCKRKLKNGFQTSILIKWIPLYSRVTFSDRPYAEALAIGDEQNEIMEHV
jgi:kynurenine 3-monooxygenase